MFVPAAVLGVLFGILLWVIALLLLRTYGCVRRRLCPSLHDKEQQQEMKELARPPWREVEEREAVHLRPQEGVVGSYVDTRKIAEFKQSVEDLVRRGYLAEGGGGTTAPSSRSSPKSISSGIGVSSPSSDKDDEEGEGVADLLRRASE